MTHNDRRAQPNYRVAAAVLKMYDYAYMLMGLVAMTIMLYIIYLYTT